MIRSSFCKLQIKKMCSSASIVGENRNERFGEFSHISETRDAVAVISFTKLFSDLTIGKTLWEARAICKFSQFGARQTLFLCFIAQWKHTRRPIRKHVLSELFKCFTYKLKRPENDFFGLITEIKWFDLNIWKKPFVIEEEVIYSLNLLINARILRIVAKILLNFISVL